MGGKTRRWDASEHLDSEQAIAAYLNAALQENDPSLIAAVLGDIARARGMSRVARETRLSRESLYRALSDGGNPELDTLLKVMNAFQLRLSVAKAPARTGKADRARMARRRRQRAVA